MNEVFTTENTESTENLGSSFNNLTKAIIGGAIAVHRELGPGLLESAYEACLVFELLDRGLSVERQKPDASYISGSHGRLRLPNRPSSRWKHYRGIKAVERLEPIHEAQVLSYLRLSGCKIGLLINFNVRTLRQGIRRLVN
jgi:hypothetical protein